MISVVVYEHLTAIQAGNDQVSLPASLLREGKAMLAAVSADLLRIPDIRREIATSAEELTTHAEVSDFALVIAPEFDGILHSLASRVLAAGGVLLGPSPDAIRLTSDKLRLCEWWKAHGVPTPATWEFQERAVVSPIVVKPRDGAGSQATRLLMPGEASTDEDWTGPLIAQDFVEGIAASVAFLCGPAGMTPLKPCEQLLSADGRFQYLGGRILVDAELSSRANTIAQRAVDCVPGLLGYVGVDVVLGSDGRDWAIEINPRLTTSYIGLRQMSETNLMAAMIEMAWGKDVHITWKDGGCEFTTES